LSDMCGMSYVVQYASFWFCGFFILTKKVGLNNAEWLKTNIDSMVFKKSFRPTVLHHHCQVVVDSTQFAVGEKKNCLIYSMLSVATVLTPFGNKSVHFFSFAF